MFSAELLDDILPRIRRQLSMQTDHVSLQEEAPTRGEVDWQRTMTRTINETPDHLPLRLDTRQRRQHMGTPENLLFVALLLQHRHVVQDLLKKDQNDELLTDQERLQLVSISERIERELATPDARSLAEEARSSDIDTFVEQVAIRLRPGTSPYRDLLTWWEQFNSLYIGLANDNRRLTLASHRRNEQMDNWLYELWIALEIITLLQEKFCISRDTMHIQHDQLSFTFTWDDRRYVFRYQRRLSPPGGTLSGWEQVPALQPGYTIEREHPVEIKHKDALIWREPPFVMATSYATGGSTEAHLGAAVQEILGSMSLQDAHVGALIFPLLSDPAAGRQFSGEIKRDGKRYTGGMAGDTSISLYKITPDMSIATIQQRLLAIIQQAAHSLPEREKPACHGVMFDPDTVNASLDSIQTYDVLCPKPHLGKGVFDLVSREKHCLKDPRLCHVIGQTLLPPRVERVNNLDDLKDHISELRVYSEEALRQAEQEENEEKAEQLRSQILYAVGNMIERYVESKSDTAWLEKYLGMVFKTYWKRDGRCLAEETRDILISGEYVWGEYEGAELKDWAAPAIQYCRALERELKRRLYEPDPTIFTLKAHEWTLGKYKRLYEKRGEDPVTLKNWNGLLRRSRASGTKDSEFIGFIKLMISENISDLRNKLAHGEQINKATAENIRVAILGKMDMGMSGMLHWVVEHLDPKRP
jgi:hypothetical protein